MKCPRCWNIWHGEPRELFPAPGFDHSGCRRIRVKSLFNPTVDMMKEINTLIVDDDQLAGANARTGELVGFAGLATVRETVFGELIAIGACM
jgi:hypothetical protein